MDKLIVKRFSWKNHSELVKKFHEDIILSNIGPEHLSREAYLQLLRSSEKNGLPAYMRTLKAAYEKGKDGMFIWELKGKIVGWSWLRIYENEFFKEGAYGEINEIYIVPEWRGKGIGNILMKHAEDWFRNKGIKTVRVEALATNEKALAFYRKHGFKPNYITLQKEISNIQKDDNSKTYHELSEKKVLKEHMQRESKQNGVFLSTVKR